MQYSALPQQGQPGEGEGGGGWRGVAAQKESFAQKRFADPDENNLLTSRWRCMLQGCKKFELQSLWTFHCVQMAIYICTSKSDQYEREK